MQNYVRNQSGIVGEIFFCCGQKRTAFVKAHTFVTATEIKFENFLEALNRSTQENKVNL